MLNLILVIAIIYCAFQVMNSARLLNVTIWLAFTSAVTAILIYTLGAPYVAVIELSVGAGLVTVLFVFAFSIVGEVTLDEITLVPRPFAWILILAAAFVVGWFVYPLPVEQISPPQIPFGEMLWNQRGLDVIAQMVLIFSGVMGLIGLLSEARPSREAAIAEIIEQRALAEGRTLEAGPVIEAGPSGEPARSAVEEVKA